MNLTIFGHPANSDEDVAESLGYLMVRHWIDPALALIGIRCYITGLPAHLLEAA